MGKRKLARKTMIIVTVKVVKSPEDENSQAALGVNVFADNTQVRKTCSASLGLNESAEFQLELNRCGAIVLTLNGWTS